MTVNVTKQLIAAGVRSQCERCPVALAIQSQLPVGVFAYVGQLDVVICDARLGNDKAISRDYSFPDWVVEKVKRFDAGGGMESFEFELHVAEEFLRVV